MTEFAVLTDRGTLLIAAGDRAEAARLAEGDGYRVLAVDGEPTTTPLRLGVTCYSWWVGSGEWTGDLPFSLFARLDGGTLRRGYREYYTQEEALDDLRSAIATQGERQ